MFEATDARSIAAYMFCIFSYHNHLDLARSCPVHLSDNRTDSSSAEAVVLMAITGHGQTPAIGGTYYHRQRESPTILPLSYPAASHPHTRGAPHWVAICRTLGMSWVWLPKSSEITSCVFISLGCVADSALPP
ncbi:hypothetical protein AVEN_207520-1 [Araneus ventricosus]|uniref:Uncharacterized protein n=1 Tax=Araneus ventricosus TaxID=182803 RepID=A0A4Y2NRQ8_ARAVE|nr:hypothetical protein AVEN_207520-1 [Araneus ventricosus]